MPRNLHAFSQEKDPRFPNGAGKGVCLTMSAWYLILAANGEDYWSWFDEQADEVHRIGNITRAPDFYFREMSAVGKLLLGERFEAPTARLAPNVLQGARGPFRLAVMESDPPWNLAHAIACYMGLKIRVLDVSGGGEFEFDSREEAWNWLDAHVQTPRVRHFDARLRSYAEGFPRLTVYGFMRGA